VRLFFDTNVIISAIVSRGLSFDVIKDSVYKHEGFYTDYLLKETRKVLSSKFPLSDETVKGAVSLIKKYFTKGKTSYKVDKICRDPEDNQILADVAANEIDILITGDKDLLVLKNYKTTKIILPVDYWKL